MKQESKQGMVGGNPPTYVFREVSTSFQRVLLAKITRPDTPTQTITDLKSNGQKHTFEIEKIKTEYWQRRTKDGSR